MPKVLVVVDMQNDFINGALGTKEAQAIVGNVVEKIEKFEGEIFITMDTHFEDYLETLEGKNLPVEHCISGTKGWKLNAEVLEALNNKEKMSFDKVTFGSIDLSNHINTVNTYNNLEEVELVGLCTDICVISNALLIKATTPEIKITVDASCCAGVTPESHKIALEAMKMCQINIVNE